VWRDAAASLAQAGVPEQTVAKFGSANTLAAVAGDDPDVVQAVAGKFDHIPSVKEIALSFSLADWARALPGKDDAAKLQAGTALRRALFALEPTAVVRRMAQDRELALGDRQAGGKTIPGAALQAGIAQLLTNLPDFDLRTSNLTEAVHATGALQGIEQGLVP